MANPRCWNRGRSTKPVTCNRPLRSYERSAEPIRSITTIRSRPGRSSLTGAYLMFSSREHSMLPGLGLILGQILSACPFAGAAESGHLGYGNKATPEQIAGWDIDVRGDDCVGLPAGSGTVTRGEEVYAEQCAACHGTFSNGKRPFPKLVTAKAPLRANRPHPPAATHS